MQKYRSLKDLPHRVTIDRMLEYHMHWTIAIWLRRNFGADNHCVTWRHVLAGSPSINDPDFGTYAFLNEEDATLFAMRWL